MIAMINHLSGHATVDADVFACDESCLVRAEKQHHIGNVQWIANTSCRLLHRICALIFLIVSIYPGEMELTLALPRSVTARAWVRAASATEFLHILTCWYYIEVPRENASFRALVLLMSPFSLTPLTSIFPQSSRWK